jgi:hypothetical protein
LILKDVPRWVEIRKESLIQLNPMKRKAFVEPMNLVESMEEIVEISKVNVDEEFGNKTKILK